MVISIALRWQCLCYDNCGIFQELYEVGRKIERLHERADYNNDSWDIFKDSLIKNFLKILGRVVQVLIQSKQE